MKHIVAAGTRVELSAGLKPGIYDLQNAGTTNVYWARLETGATAEAGQLLAAGFGDELYLDGVTGPGRDDLWVYAVPDPNATATAPSAPADLRLEYKRPAT